MSEQYPPAPASSTPPQAPQYTFPPQDQPVSGYQSSPTPSTPGSGMAIGAMVLGILGILSFWVPVFNIGAILLAIVGVILGVLAIRGIKRGTQSGKGMAIAGIVLSALTIVGAIVVNVATFAFVKSIEEQTTADLDDAIADLDSAGEPAAEEPPAEAGSTSSSVDPTGEWPTCDELVPEVVSLSESDIYVSILQVYGVSTTSDQTAAFDAGQVTIPEGQNMVSVLDCTGTAALDDGTEAPLDFSLEVDVNDELFVAYETR
ncbi:MAG: DUF4190 domain-containing protein [Actinomycetota bacterium]